LTLFFISCSSDSTEPEPEIDQQTDDEIMIEEDNDDEEVGEEEEPFTFPFSISVVLKEFSNVAQREGQFNSIDFFEGASNPAAPINLTQMLNLDLNAGIGANGQENVIVFGQKFGTLEKEYLTFNLDTQRIYSANRTELIIPSENCYFEGSHIGANSENILAFNYDSCSVNDGLILFLRNYDTNINSELLSINSGYTGDSAHRIWANDKYLFVHFDSFNIDNPDNITGDGLVIYDAKTLELIYETRTAENKIPVIDGDKVVIRKNFDTMELYDLELRQSLFTNSISWSEGPYFEGNIGNASIFRNKVGGLMRDVSGAQGVPGIYDFETNNIEIFNTEEYSNFFRNTGLPVPNPIRQPKEHKFDLESETFIVLYHGFTQGFIQNDNPDFIGLVYMNFEGEILYEYIFEERQWLEQIIIKR